MGAVRHSDRQHLAAEPVPDRERAEHGDRFEQQTPDHAPWPRAPRRRHRVRDAERDAVGQVIEPTERRGQSRGGRGVSDQQAVRLDRSEDPLSRQGEGHPYGVVAERAECACDGADPDLLAQPWIHHRQRSQHGEQRRDGSTGQQRDSEPGRPPPAASGGHRCGGRFSRSSFRSGGSGRKSLISPYRSGWSPPGVPGAGSLPGATAAGSSPGAGRSGESSYETVCCDVSGCAVPGSWTSRGAVTSRSDPVPDRSGSYARSRSEAPCRPSPPERWSGSRPVAATCAAATARPAAAPPTPTPSTVPTAAEIPPRDPRATTCPAPGDPSQAKTPPSPSSEHGRPSEETHSLQPPSSAYAHRTRATCQATTAPATMSMTAARGGAVRTRTTDTTANTTPSSNSMSQPPMTQSVNNPSASPTITMNGLTMTASRGPAAGATMPHRPRHTRISAKLRITPIGVAARASSTSPRASETAEEMSVEITRLTATPQSSMANARERLVVMASPNRRGNATTSARKFVQPRDQA